VREEGNWRVIAFDREVSVAPDRPLVVTLRV
jgi:hypothetical protein